MKTKFEQGDTVNFHAIIGGPITSTDHEIMSIVRVPNNFGCDVAWITGHSGCVALDALSKTATQNNKDECNETKDIEEFMCPALGQYRHSRSDGIIHAYDMHETHILVGGLMGRIVELENEKKKSSRR